MTLSVQISEEELLFNAILTGENAPDENESLISKFRQADEDNKTGLESGFTTFDTHNHTAHGMQLGSVMPGGTARADSFVDEAFTLAKTGPLSVTGRAIGSGEVYGNRIPDLEYTEEKIGDADTEVAVCNNGSNTTVTHNLGNQPLFHIESWGSELGGPIFVKVVDVTSTTIVLTVPDGIGVTSFSVLVVFR